MTEDEGCLDSSAEEIERRPLSRSHFTMNKFAKPTENDFLTVCDFLKQWEIGDEKPLPEPAKTISSTYLRRYQPISSPLFTGRQDILDILEGYFEARGTGRHHRREFLLYGLGGAGKTQLMLKFAEINQSRYKNPIVPHHHYTIVKLYRFEHIF